MARYERTLHVLRTPQAAEVSAAPTITREDLMDKDGSAFVLRQVLSPSECKFFIQQAEAFGLEDCGYDPEIRVTDRVAAESKPVARMIFDRILPFLEPSIDLTTADYDEGTWPNGVPQTFRRWCWYPLGLNEVFRLCRYKPGGFFLPHHDGGFVRSEFERSIKTFMIYLNDDFEGGPTNVYQETQNHYTDGDPDKVIYSFRPKAGDALVFNSSITHDGGMVEHGKKYLMRSEIMYSPLLPEETKPSDSCPPDHDPVDDSFVPDGYY